MQTTLSAITLYFLLGLNLSLATTITVSFGQHDSAPYAITEGEKLVGGIIKDLMDALADELKIKVVYKRIPRTRTVNYLLTGSIDVMPISNPQWVVESEKLFWSIPLFEELNKFVVKKV